MFPPLPTKQKALWLTEKHGKFVVGEADIPKPGPGEVLIREEAVGVNLVDHLTQQVGIFADEYPTILGWEGAGVVLQLGEGVRSVAVGDRVLHPGRGGSLAYATYKQYSTIPADLTAQLPRNLNYDHGAAIPLTLDTAALGLYAPPAERGGAGLVAPWQPDGLGKYAGQPIFILGGSSSVGQFVIQLARLSGFSPIIATASLKNAEYLKSLGATHVLDRNLSTPSVRAAVEQITIKPFQVVYDAVSFEETQNTGYDLLAPGGVIVIVTHLKIPQSKLTADKRLTIILADPTLPDRRQLAVGLYKKIPAYFASGQLKTNNIEVLPDGLAGILGGLERLSKDQVSAKKLIAHPQETSYRSIPAALMKGLTKEPIHLVYDAVSSVESQNIGYDLLASGGVVVIVHAAIDVAEDKRTTDKHIIFAVGSPFLPDRRQFSADMYRMITTLFASGELKPNRIEVLSNGFVGIPAGLERLKHNEISESKLVACS